MALCEARVERALSQRIYLMHQERCVLDQHQRLEYQVMGASNVQYKVVLDSRKARAKGHGTSCTCPDFTTRHSTCKHILFVLLRVCKLSLAGAQQDLGRLMAQLWQRPASAHAEEVPSPSASATVKPADPEDECAVCMEVLGCSEPLLACTHGCKHYFHEDCIMRWLRVGTSCPLCRADWFK